MMDQNSKDSPENPTTERPNNLNAVEELLADEDVNMYHNENICMAPTPALPPAPQRFALPSMHDESRYGRRSAAEAEVQASMNECECPELQEQPQHVPLPEMSTPRFNASSYEMPELPIERPHCPVPNNQMFMPPHVFNPQVFPQPTHASYNYSPNVQYDPNPEQQSPDSSSMPENPRPVYPIPNPRLHFGLTHMYQPPAGIPPAPPRGFNISEAGPSHGRNNPVPGGLSSMPPMPPVSLNVPGSIHLTCQQMSNLRGELRRVSSIFSRLATIVQRKRCAPLPRTTRIRPNPFGRATGAPSSMRCPDADVSNFGPTKAKQLKAKQTITKSSTPKVPEQPAAAPPNIGLLTIAPPTVGPTPGKPANLTLAILKPSMLCYNGRSHAVVQTDPLRYNSFAGRFRSQSSTDTDDQLDENGNITNPKPKPKPNLKRRHSDADS